MKKNQRLVLATWPNQATIRAKYGQYPDKPQYDCEGLYLQLRVVDEQLYSDHNLNCLALYVWYDRTKIRIEPRLHDVRSMDYTQVEKIAKLLKSLAKKLNTDFNTEAPIDALTKAFAALKIDCALEYRPMTPETTALIYKAAFDIANLIELERKDFK